MRIITLLFPIFLIACSTPERPKDENTRMIWGQEDKSIEDIFGKISDDDHYHTNGAWGFGQVVRGTIMQVDASLRVAMAIVGIINGVTTEM